MDNKKIIKIERELTFNKKDFENAKLLLKEERIENVDILELFRAGVYCILAQAERYDKQIKVYRRLLNNGFVNPENYFGNDEKLKQVLRYTHYPNMKLKRIKDFAGWYGGSAIPHVIIQDVRNGGKRGKELRDALAERAPSLGYKSASLVMIKCGYEDVIPIDIWVMRFLKGKGCNVKVPDYMTVGGMTKKTYLRLEDVLRKMAEEAGVSLAVFQGALWGKYSTWKVRKEERLF